MAEDDDNEVIIPLIKKDESTSKVEPTSKKYQEKGGDFHLRQDKIPHPKKGGRDENPS